MAIAFLVITGVLLIVFRVIWKRSKLIQRILVSLAGTMLFVGILFSFPFENLFYQWDSPESLFQYLNIKPIEYIVEGKNSCMVIYRSSEVKYSSSLLIKHDGKYLIPRESGSEHVVSQVISNGMLLISKFENDYYVKGVTIFPSDSETAISDNLNSVFAISETTQVDGRRTVDFSAYLADFNYEYSITVGEETTDIAFAS